jgi:hypothetical protein
MMLRIERTLARGRAVVRLIGRLQGDYLAEVKAEIESSEPRPALDLQEVTLVDVEAVRFLVACENRGVDLLHCSPYIRRWVARERAHAGRS